jgi:hypothetical protein
MLYSSGVSADPGPVGIRALDRLDLLPRLRTGIVSGQVSSHDRTGGNDDGFSGTYSYLYREGEEYVLFDAAGPGCVYSLWLTYSYGTLTPDQRFGRFRFRLDGESIPRVDIGLAEMFAGTNAPFLAPLVGNGWTSAGGFFCYLPIPYRQSLRISCTARPDFYRITYHSYSADEPVVSFTGGEDTAMARQVWANPGTDPKPTAGNEAVTGVFDIPVGASVPLVSLTGPGEVESLRLQLPILRWTGEQTTNRNVLRGMRLQAFWDGESGPSVDAPLGEFFGCGAGAATVRSLLLGMGPEGLYCFFPMPFNRSARLTLRNESGFSLTGVSFRVEHRVVASNWVGVGYFRARHREESPIEQGRDYRFVRTVGRGHLVGVVHTIDARDGEQPVYLEGDERIYLDGSRSPLIGTGTEDYYNGGWYFSGAPRCNASHGVPFAGADDRLRLACYRLHLSDLLPYQSLLRFGIEAYALWGVRADYSSTAFYYEAPSLGMALTDVLDVGDVLSESLHAYQLEGGVWVGTNAFAYEGEQDSHVIEDQGRAFSNACSFRVQVDPANDGVCLRRRLDQGRSRTRALVRVDGERAGLWQTSDTNAYKRWLDSDFLLPAQLTQGKSNVEIRVESQGPEWNEYGYWVYSLRPANAPAAATDADADGLSDGWELHWFDGLGALGHDDPDGDGSPNCSEYVAGTDPTNADSRFELALLPSESGARIGFAAGPAEGPGYETVTRSYTLYVSSNLASTGSWASWPPVEQLAVTCPTNIVVMVTNGAAYARGVVELRPQPVP